MGVKDRPQCYFDVELNREPGKIISYHSTGMIIRLRCEQPQLIFIANYFDLFKLFSTEVVFVAFELLIDAHLVVQTESRTPCGALAR